MDQCFIDVVANPPGTGMTAAFKGLGFFSGSQRRVLAQVLFFASGACAALFFGGVELSAQLVLAAFLAISCVIASTIGLKSKLQFSKAAVAVSGLLFAWLLISLCPWPVLWAKQLAPGQAKLLEDLNGWRPSLLHLSMAPHATWHAFFLLTGAGAIVYLSWSWASQRSFRLGLSIFILAAASMVAALRGLDLLSSGHLIYDLRSTSNPEHWGPFINRNHFSNYLNMGVLVGLGLFFRYSFPRRNQKRSPLFGWGCLVASVFCACMSMSTASKGGLLSLAVALLVFTILLFRRRHTAFYSQLMLIGLMLFAAFLLAYGRTTLQRTETWFDQLSYSKSEGRSEIWRNAWRMGVAMHGRGIGVGSFEYVYPAFQTSQGDKTITHVENEYLQMWVEWGWVGSFLWGLLGVLLVNRAVRKLNHHPSEREIANWSVIVLLAVHSLVDFPLHIPANAWIAAALLGVLMRGHSEEEKTDEAVEFPVFASRNFWILLGLGGLLFLAVPLALSQKYRPLTNLERELKHQEYERAWKDSRNALETWPFYWRAHELAGNAGAGLPSMSREVQSCFRRAQRLGQINPMISFRAGRLFLQSQPAVARSFFERSLSISERPDLLVHHIFKLTHKEEAKIRALLPIALRDSQCWVSACRFLASTPFPQLLSDWMQEGASRWLDSPEDRCIATEILIWGGMQNQVIASFQRVPARSDQDLYWQGRALQAARLFEEAAGVFESIWKKRMVSLPKFANTIELNELMLRRAVLESGNLKLQREMAASLFQAGRYEEAMVPWERILHLEPRNPQARYGMAISCQKLGDWEKAAKCWRILVEDTLGFSPRL